MRFKQGDLVLRNSPLLNEGCRLLIYTKRGDDYLYNMMDYFNVNTSFPIVFIDSDHVLYTDIFQELTPEELLSFRLYKR